jgi:osmotically-inducible protein OsmY
MDGKVTLRGTVKSEEEKKNLEMQAKAVAGVKSIDNKLEVKSE